MPECATSVEVVSVDRLEEGSPVYEDLAFGRISVTSAIVPSLKLRVRTGLLADSSSGIIEVMHLKLFKVTWYGG